MSLRCLHRCRFCPNRVLINVRFLGKERILFYRYRIQWPLVLCCLCLGWDFGFVLNAWGQRPLWMEIGDSTDFGTPWRIPYDIASSLCVLFLCRCYRYVKERLYRPGFLVSRFLYSLDQLSQHLRQLRGQLLDLRQSRLGLGAEFYRFGAFEASAGAGSGGVV